MGYELTMLVGEVKPDQSLEESGLKWLKVIASVCLGKFHLDADELSKDFEYKIFFYAPAGDGGVEIKDDMYGSELRAIPLEDSFHMIEDLYLKSEEQDKRYDPLVYAYELLRSMTRLEKKFHVVYYGH